MFKSESLWIIIIIMDSTYFIQFGIWSPYSIYEILLFITVCIVSEVNICSEIIETSWIIFSFSTECFVINSIKSVERWDKDNVDMDGWERRTRRRRNTSKSTKRMNFFHPTDKEENSNGEQSVYHRLLLLDQHIDLGTSLPNWRWWLSS